MQSDYRSHLITHLIMSINIDTRRQERSHSFNITLCTSRVEGIQDILKPMKHDMTLMINTGLLEMAELTSIAIADVMDASANEASN
jgi:hypothetical protein